MGQSVGARNGKCTLALRGLTAELLSILLLVILSFNFSAFGILAASGILSFILHLLLLLLTNGSFCRKWIKILKELM